MKPILTILTLVACAQAQQVTALRCGSVLDVTAGKLTPGGIIVVSGNTIQQANATAVPAGAKVIDLSKGVCMPGLIDVHTHLTGDSRGAGYKGLGISVPRSALMGASNARKTLLAGFTTVRDVGANGYADVALRDAINEGDVDGPRLRVSGPALGITGGHCDNSLLAPEFNYKDSSVADGPWAVRAKVREVVKYGADHIKICASGGVLSKGDQPGVAEYTEEEIRAIVEEAHKLGRKVAAHAHGGQSIKDSIRAGVDSVEHCSLIDDEGIALAKQKGTFLVFDIYNDDYILEMGAKIGMLEESLEKERQIGKTQRQNFLKAWRGGVRMAFGSDAGVYPHGDNWKQFPYMVEFGMTPAQALKAATIEAAELIGWSGNAGVLKQGAWADIIAVEGDPIADIRNMQNVRFVMKDGKIYRNDWRSSFIP